MCPGICIYENAFIRWSFRQSATLFSYAKNEIFELIAQVLKPMVRMQFCYKISYLILFVPNDASLACWTFFFLLTQCDFFIRRGPNSSLRRDRGRRPTTRLYKMGWKKQREIMRRNCNLKSRWEPTYKEGLCRINLHSSRRGSNWNLWEETKLRFKGHSIQFTWKTQWLI